MNERAREPGGRPVASVARALALLDALADHPPGLGVNELARRIGVNASTASRLLGTLQRGRYVDRDPGGPYRLGLRFVALAEGVLARIDVRELARPRLRALMEETGETATLSVPGATEAITVDFVPSGASVMSMAHIGRPSVAHATAVGKVMLAFGGEAATPNELTAYTPLTITDPAVLADEVAAVREHGWSVAAGEREPELNALAVPVFDHRGALMAIVGLQGPAARLTDERRRAVLPAVRATAAALSRAVGHEIG